MKAEIWKKSKKINGGRGRKSVREANQKKQS